MELLAKSVPHFPPCYALASFHGEFFAPILTSMLVKSVAHCQCCLLTTPTVYLFNPFTFKTIEIPLTPKTPFGDATLSGYCGDNKDERIYIIFYDPRSRIDLNWKLIIFSKILILSAR